MGKYIDKINSYLEKNEGTKKVKLLKFFAPLLLILFIKILFFSYNFATGMIASMLPYLVFSMILYILIYRYVKKKFDNCRRILSFVYFVFFPFFYIVVDIILTVLALLVESWYVDYLILLSFSAYIYFQVEKNKSWQLMDNIINLKQSVWGLIICVLIDYVIYMLFFVRNGQYLSYTIQIKDYASFYNSYLYIVFVLTNIISYLESYFIRYKKELTKKINLCIEVGKKIKKVNCMENFLFVFFILFVNIILKEFDFDHLDRAIWGIDVALYSFYLAVFTIFLFVLINNNLKKILKDNFNQKLFLTLYICSFKSILKLVDVIIVILGTLEITDRVYIILPLLFGLYFLRKRKIYD